MRSGFGGLQSFSSDHIRRRGDRTPLEPAPQQPAGSMRSVQSWLSSSKVNPLTVWPWGPQMSTTEFSSQRQQWSLHSRQLTKHWPSAIHPETRLDRVDIIIMPTLLNLKLKFRNQSKLHGTPGSIACRLIVDLLSSSLSSTVMTYQLVLCPSAGYLTSHSLGFLSCAMKIIKITISYLLGDLMSS